MLISNDTGKTLESRLQELIKKSAELKFLVGFFYFSGMKSILQCLNEDPEITLKILVGLNVDNLVGQIVEYGVKKPENRQDREIYGYNNLSQNQKVENYLVSLKNSLNNRRYDTREFYEHVKFFLQMIEEERLIIRKTLDPNHAKVYILNQKEGESIKQFVITGSSNLTESGMKTQNELNVELRDELATKQVEKYFDERWDTAIPLTEDDEVKNRIINTIQDETQVAQITPYEAYIKVLDTYIAAKEQQDLSPGLKDLLKSNGFEAYQYQLDAVKQALTSLRDYNGVIIADVVGLGKSVISSMIIRELGNAKGIIVSPPGLIGDAHTSGWERYREVFDYKQWDVISSGSLEGELDKYQDPSIRDEYEYVLVDEAHRFRNESTSSYDALNFLCKNRKVILLTATPFNNSPQDFFSLVKLFDIPKSSRISVNSNLDLMFREFKLNFDRLAYIRKHWNSKDGVKKSKAEMYYKTLFGKKEEIDMAKVNERARFLSQEVRAVIEPVLIRRNRKDLLEDPIYQKDIPELSKVNDPEPQFFELTQKQSEFYDRVIKEYFGTNGKFSGAIYRPGLYEKGNYKKESTADLNKEANQEFQYQRNLYDFMVRNLVKRFESSFGAFYKSIENVIRIHEFAWELIDEKGVYILNKKFYQEYQDLDFDDIDEKIKDLKREMLALDDQTRRKAVYELKKVSFKQSNEFRENVLADLELLKSIKKEIEELGLHRVENDPKIAKLVDSIRLLRTAEPSRKVVIFTEYQDTLSWIRPILEEAFEQRVLSVDKGIDDDLVKKIKSNFDASDTIKDKKDDYDIILGTDRISEGFNLNRAGLIINYDIPWNPTRVIQRVGRINRMSKKVFEELYIYNYFPTVKGNTVLQSKETAETKMFMIHSILGEDAKIFTPDEEPSAAGLYQRLSENPEDSEDPSFITLVRKELFAFQEQYPDKYERVQKLPGRVKVAKASNQDKLLLFLQKGKAFQVRTTNYDPAEQPEDQSLEEVIPEIKVSMEEKPIELSDNFWNHYPSLQKPFTKSKGAKGGEDSQSLAAKKLQEYQPQISQDLKAIALEIERDFREFGTLSDQFASRINKSEGVSEIEEALQFAKENSGEGYLQKISDEVESSSLDVIIAIENRKE